MLNATNGLPAACVEICRYRGDDADYVALMRNAEVDADSLGHVEYQDNAGLETSSRVQVIFPRQAQVTDARTGKSFGVTDRVTVNLNPWSPTILKLDTTP